MMTAMSNGIFMEDLKGMVNTHRMVLQEMYMESILAGALQSERNPYDAASKAVMYSEVLRIQELLKANPGSGETKAHRALLLKAIEKAQNN
jgi:hypothetical protein